jgi:LysM repeat protein
MAYQAAASKAPYVLVGKRNIFIADNDSSTYTLDVTCDYQLPSIAFGGYFPSSDDLTALCNSDCLQSLEALRISQQQSCAADVMVLSGDVYPITATVDALLYTYNYTCRRDADTGGFCAPIFDSWANGNASDESCSDCVLGTYQLQLGNSLGYNDDLAANFSSLTSSCQATGYAVTSPPPNIISATVTATTTAIAPTKSCASIYTVKSGDDCHTISTSQNVSLNQMLYFNNLEAGCTDFPSLGVELCMPHTCQIYTVQANDTCSGIVASLNTMTISQLGKT